MNNKKKATRKIQESYSFKKKWPREMKLVP
jgi:hypothetical protein